jgi:Helix-turn-helix domain
MTAIPANFVGTITQEQWDAIPDAGSATKATVKSGSRRIRCHDRAAQWQCEIYRSAADLTAASPGDANAIAEALEREIKVGPDFTRVRRAYSFRSLPKVSTDRNVISKIYAICCAIEKRSHTKDKHGGTLGRAAKELMRVLLYVVNKSGGYLCPSYDTLAKMTGYCRRTVVTAMAMLQRMGFVTVHRRSKWVQTLFGPKLVQDSNAYVYHLPSRGLGALARAIFAPSSECNSFQARNIAEAKKEAINEELQVRCHSPPRSPPPAARASAA